MIASWPLLWSINCRRCLTWAGRVSDRTVEHTMTINITFYDFWNLRKAANQEILTDN
ncbi:hypothetical protein [Nostoc sp.]|uniref:hypothetical protein n=1 Tax=Nostoc sp. TaxID=1180 RepID=UPI002FFC797E